MNKLTPFIIEDGLNTSYIDSLFISLFYKQSYIQNILSDVAYNVIFTYLQDLIFYNFIHNMRKHYTIDSATMNEIRNYLIMCGWKDDQDMIEMYTPQDLYSFMIDGFTNDHVTFTTIDGKNKVIDKYIQLSVIENASIYDMMVAWQTNNGIASISNNSISKEIAKYIPIYLYRDTKYNNFQIDITGGITFGYGDGQRLWVIHSIVCFTKSDRGHYYSVIKDTDGWYLFSNKHKPSLVKVDITDDDIMVKIKQECVFLLYTIDGLVA